MIQRDRKETLKKDTCLKTVVRCLAVEHLAKCKLILIITFYFSYFTYLQPCFF